MIAKPTKHHLKWHAQEIGVIIHLDLWTFARSLEHASNPSYGVGTLPLKVFDPAELNTDQWLEAAAALGAKYAVFVASHGSGLAMWPSAADENHVGNTPWGKRRTVAGLSCDIVQMFRDSCAKYGILPGLYYNTNINYAYGVKESGKVPADGCLTQERYARLVEKQVEELWSGYGEWFEIWFDGGVLPPEKGGPDLVPILEKYQPNAVCFQGPPEHKNNLRWVGTESGRAPFDCWGACDGAQSGWQQNGGAGDPDSPIYAPAECDFPNRRNNTFQGGWFWHPESAAELLPTEHLFDCYLQTVGRGFPMLLGMPIDNRGLLSDAEMRQFASFGAYRAAQMEDALFVQVSAERGAEVFLSEPKQVAYAVLQEDITDGAKIRGYTTAVLADGEWKDIFSANSLGFKRIIKVPYASISGVRVSVSQG
ncbi:MAG: alpha-L-fucosidase [Oscillospiraceae bacterium]|jgi:alpha-L-fucosidase|nr:alpha-L-fucosidase [Oscillospiraceae bacterium]